MSSGPLLIFGTSLSGKSSLAARISTVTGWEVASTDRMGRHPGRPWTDVPAPVIEHYASLSDEAILWFLHVHHRNMWPIICRRIGLALDEGRGIVEGAALRPEFLAQIDLRRATVIGLRIAPDPLRARIVSESGYGSRDPMAKRVIDAFATRCLHENDALSDAAERYGFDMVDVGTGAAVDDLASKLGRTLVE